MQIDSFANDNVKVAIISTHQSHYDAIRLLFDAIFEDFPQTSHQGVPCRTVGHLGKWVTVLVCIIGKLNIVNSITSIMSAYTTLQLVLVTGIVRTLRWLHTGVGNINPGDVIISRPGDELETGPHYFGYSQLDHVPEQRSSQPNRSIHTVSPRLSISLDKGELQRLATQSQNVLHAKDNKEIYDKPIPAGPGWVMILNSREQYDAGEQRRQSEGYQTHKIHFETINLEVIKSTGTLYISEQQHDIGVELKRSGVLGFVPCNFVSGVWDNNGSGQDYAASTAACTAKAILDSCNLTRNVQERISDDRHIQRHRVFPFGRNRNFIGRQALLGRLLGMISPDADLQDCQRTAIVGLGGVGKTQVAIEAAYSLVDKCSVFWVPVVDASSLTKAFLEIGRQLAITDFKDEINAVRLVRDALSCETTGNWLLIFDNADDNTLLFDRSQSMPLADYLPFSPRGSILFTTRNYEVAVKLDVRTKNIVRVCEMTKSEAMELLQEDLREQQTRDEKSTHRLLETLAYFPLAIKQASVFMASKGMSTTRYLKHCEARPHSLLNFLHEAFVDCRQYKAAQSSVATTWEVSFEYIARDTPLAAAYLKFMCFLAAQDIQLDQLPMLGTELEVDIAFGALIAYSFLTERNELNSFDFHPLVRQAVYNWVKNKGTQEQEHWATEVISHLSRRLPSLDGCNTHAWARYLPHAETALSLQAMSKDTEVLNHLRSIVQEGHRLLGGAQRGLDM